MKDILIVLKDTPLPTILVVEGIVFLLLSIAKQLAGNNVSMPPERQRWAAVIGSILLAIGLVLTVVPPMSPESQGVTDKQKKPVIQVQPEAQSNSKSQTSKPSETSLPEHPMPVTWEPTFDGAKDIVSDLRRAQATSPGISAEDELSQAKFFYT
jgi:uncharacterized protein YjeT (DUF2065 family)